MPTPFKQPISVLVVIHTKDKQFLLLERAKHPGLWQSVTGSREDDEALIDTARRELFEETGIRAEDGLLTDWHQTNQYEIFPQWRHRYADGVTHNTEHVFSFCVPAGTTVQLCADEHRAFKWLGQTEAAETCFSWSNRDAILAL